MHEQNEKIFKRTRDGMVEWVACDCCITWRRV